MRERFSRRDFLKFSSLALSSLLLPDFLKTESNEVAPLTHLNTLYTNNTLVRLTPFISPYERNYYKPQKWFRLSGLPLEYINPEVVPADSLGIKNIERAFAQIAKIPHITGSLAEFEAILSWSDNNSPVFASKEFDKLNSNLIATYSYSDQENIYANKLFNILTALAALARHQNVKGPFMPGETYSYIDILNLVRRIDDYHGALNMGAGVCATATVFSKTVFLSNAQGLTEEVDRSMHTEKWRYWTNQLDPGITKENSDATVYFYPLYAYPPDIIVDYKFKVRKTSQPLYVSVAADLNFDQERRLGDHYPPTDARITFSITLQKSKPDENQEDIILDLRKKYWDFHSPKD